MKYDLEERTATSRFPLPRGERIKVREARTLRKNQTDVERVLWFKLRNRQIEGLKFRRQERIGKYVVDFICFDKRLIIELDGGQHNEEQVKEYDKERSEWLEKEGYKVLRFWDNEVVKNLDGVLERIREILFNPHLPSAPSLQMGEGTIEKDSFSLEGRRQG